MQMKGKRLAAWKTTLAVLAMTVTAVAQGATAEEVLRASPVDDIVKQYPALMNQGIKSGLQQNTGMQPFLINSISSVVSSAFDGAGIEKQLILDLAEGMSAAQREKVVEWYQSPLASKVAKAEINAARPEVWEEIMKSGPTLTEKYKGSERAQLFDRYDEAAQATESAVDTSVAMQASMLTALNALKGANAESPEQIRQQIESQRTMLRGMLGQQVYIGYLYTYEALSVPELREYIEFLESDAGSAFVRVSNASIQQSLMGPIDAISRQLSRLFGQGSQ